MEVTSFRRPLLLVALCALLPGGAAAAAETRAPLADLDVALHVVRPAPAAGQGAADDPAAKESVAVLDRSALGVDTVTVEAGSRIADLLRSRAIEPDGEALSAVYLLNPDLRDVDQLAPGARLVLPAVARETVGPGARVQLSLLPAAKRDLATHTRAIATLAAQLDALPDERVGPPAERQEVAKALGTVRGFLDDLAVLVEERQMPLSPELLTQALAGARLVHESLDRVARPDGRWSAADRQALLGVAADMDLKAGSLDEIRGPGKSPMRWRDVEVKVAVVQLPGQRPVSDLRVFYAPEALVGEPFAVGSFPGLSPQVAKRLIEADYVFWAAPPGSSRPVTEQLRQKVRRNPEGEIQIEIAVLPPAKGSR